MDESAPKLWHVNRAVLRVGDEIDPSYARSRGELTYVDRAASDFPWVETQIEDARPPDSVSRRAAAFAFTRLVHARYFAVFEQERQQAPHFVYEVRVVGRSSRAVWCLLDLLRRRGETYDDHQRVSEAYWRAADEWTFIEVLAEALEVVGPGQRVPADDPYRLASAAGAMSLGNDRNLAERRWPPPKGPR